MPVWIRGLLFLLKRIPVILLVLIPAAFAAILFQWFTTNPNAPQTLVCLAIYVAAVLYLWKKLPQSLRKALSKVFKTKSTERNKHAH